MLAGNSASLAFYNAPERRPASTVHLSDASEALRNESEQDKQQKQSKATAMPSSEDQGRRSIHFTPITFQELASVVKGYKHMIKVVAKSLKICLRNP